ncbi:MAG TPA: hypothetical protein EYH40_04970 [Desulfurococcales archaeon]|nr:hypothetical protein [Desulfurococcales archaeon]
MSRRSPVEITIAESRYQVLTILVVVLLAILYTIAFLLGAYTACNDVNVYMEITASIRKNMENSTLLRIYNETLTYISQGNISLVLNNILYLILHVASRDFFSALIPVIPSYMFYINGIISAPITQKGMAIFISALPLVLGKIVSYSIIGSVTLIIVIDKLILKRNITLQYLQRLVLGFILLIFLSLSDILYSIVADLIVPS